MGIINYINETKAEMKHVTWPSRGQAVMYTLLVIVISIFIAALLGTFDSIFASGLTSLLNR